MILFFLVVLEGKKENLRKAISIYATHIDEAEMDVQLTGPFLFSESFSFSISI